LAETYQNSPKLWGQVLDDPRDLATYKRAARGALEVAKSQPYPPGRRPPSLPPQLLSAALRRSPAGIHHSSPHHAVVLSRSISSTSPPQSCWIKKEDTSPSRTCAKLGGAARAVLDRIGSRRRGGLEELFEYINHVL